MLSKEAFRAQFKTKVTLTESAQKFLAFSEDFHGYKIFRCLELLLLQDENGDLWSAR